MRALTRNTRTVYYSVSEGKKTPVLDKYGLKTGEYTTSYSDPVAITAVVSASTGTAEVMDFGAFTDYDRTVTVYDTTCPIKETSKLWIDAKTDEPNDFEVMRVAPSLNCIVYAVKEVTHGNV